MSASATSRRSSQRPGQRRSRHLRCPDRRLGDSRPDRRQAATSGSELRPVAAPVAADRDQQRRGAPAERFVRRRRTTLSRGAPYSRSRGPSAHRGPPRDDPARQDRPARLEALPGDLQPELVEPAERRQIGRPEGQTNSQIRTAGADVRSSVGHVEVFRMGGVGTFILGRPRPVSSHRRADTANEAITPSSVKSPIRAWPTSIFRPLPAAHQARWLPREAARVSSQRRFNPANPNSASSVSRPTKPFRLPERPTPCRASR